MLECVVELQVHTLVWQVDNVLIEARSLIQAGSLIEARGSNSDVLIEAGTPR